MANKMPKLNVDWTAAPQNLVGQINNWKDPAAIALTVSMIDSDGVQTVRAGTPFRMAFEANYRSWETQHILRPDGYYIVTLTMGVWAPAYQIQPTITMIGYRDIR